MSQSGEEREIRERGCRRVPSRTAPRTRYNWRQSIRTLPFGKFVLAAVFYVLVFIVLSMEFLRWHYRFNQLVDQSGPVGITLVTAILSVIATALVSVCFSDTYDKWGIRNWSLILIECFILSMILHHTIETQFCYLEIPIPDTEEVRLYYGETMGGCAQGDGRLFDNQGNLIYYGGFKNNMYDGYGVKYEYIDVIRNQAHMRSFECVYEGEFKDNLPDGKGKEYRYDMEYLFEKEAGKPGALYYEGDFVRGEYCGYGTLYGTEEKYEGGFFQGEKNGYGKRWRWNEDEGELEYVEALFYDNMLHGQVIWYYPNGHVEFDGIYQDNGPIRGTSFYENDVIRYEGEYSSQTGRYHGTGTKFWENGLPEYDGGWNEGKYSGYGIYCREDGTKEYEGYWENGRYFGYGIRYREDGTKEYEGGWEDGKYSGYGTKYLADGVGIVYQGDWKEGVYDGRGTLYWDNGALKYDGYWSDGNYQGHGTSYRRDASKEYQGEWSGGVHSGYGTQYFQDGITIDYEGYWEDNGFAGEGTQYYEDGEIHYKGMWIEHEFTGFCMIRWENNNTFYEGGFQDGLKEGEGKEYSRDGNLVYDGDYHEDLYHGEGVAYWPNGNVRYSGSWENGLYSGQGILYEENGQVCYEGYFSEGNDSE